MATNPNALVNVSMLDYFKQKMETDVINPADAKAIKAVSYVGNKINFFKADSTAGTPDYSFDLPAEQFLDQAQTTLESNFTWSATKYPGTTDPGLDGKPVFVLAVKGDATVKYSFVSLETLIDIYTGKATATASTTVSPSNEISVDVKISADADNIIVQKTDPPLLLRCGHQTYTYYSTGGFILAFI